MEAVQNDTATPKSFKVNRTDERPLRFRGEKIADADGKWLNGRQQTRWTEIRIYRTTGGNLVGVIEDVTLWQGEHGSTAARVCRSEAELIEYLGTSELAKAAYAEAEIECVEEIE